MMHKIRVLSHGVTSHKTFLSRIKGTQTQQTVARLTMKAFWPRATFLWASSNPLQKISMLSSIQLLQLTLDSIWIRPNEWISREGTCKRSSQARATSLSQCNNLLNL